MNRNKFITKWLGNRNYEYNAENRGLMLDDLDNLIEKSINIPVVKRRYKSIRELQIGEFVECITVNGQNIKCLTKGKIYEIFNITNYHGYFYFSIKDENNKRKQYKYTNGQFKALI